MKDIQQEQYEYEKFMSELANKVYEISQEFNKLSQENKIRVEYEMKKIFSTYGVAGVLEYISRHR